MGFIALNIAALLNEYEKTFYTEPIMIVLNMVFLILALKNNSRDKKYRIFILYGAAALFHNMIPTLVSLVDGTSLEFTKVGSRITDIAIILFIQIEFIVFYRFFYFQFEGKPAQEKILVMEKIYILLSTISTLLYVVYTPYSNLPGIASYQSTISSILLLIPAFYYFITLFRDPPVKNLLREPSFWITTGIAFLHGLNIPLFIFDNFMVQRLSAMWLNLHTIIFIAYCFLFVLFIVALGCEYLLKADRPGNNPYLRLTKVQ